MISLKVYTINQHKVTVGNLSIFFSYKTPVAFSQNENLVCMQNYWSTTTGKFLNELEPDHKKRLSMEAFNKLLREAYKNEDLQSTAIQYLLEATADDDVQEIGGEPLEYAIKYATKVLNNESV